MHVATNYGHKEIRTVFKQVNYDFKNVGVHFDVSNYFLYHSVMLPDPIIKIMAQ